MRNSTAKMQVIQRVKKSTYRKGKSLAGMRRSVNQHRTAVWDRNSAAAAFLPRFIQRRKKSSQAADKRMSVMATIDRIVH